MDAAKSSGLVSVGVGGATAKRSDPLRSSSLIGSVPTKVGSRCRSRAGCRSWAGANLGSSLCLANWTAQG